MRRNLHTYRNDCFIKGNIYNSVCKIRQNTVGRPRVKNEGRKNGNEREREKERYLQSFDIFKSRKDEFFSTYLDIKQMKFTLSKEI